MQDPISHEWLSNRAILFVHGVGNAKDGDYNPLVAQLDTILGDDGKNVVKYFFYYDQINEWFSKKEQAKAAFTKAAQFLAQLFTNAPKVDAAAKLGDAAADFGGDVIWPVLLAEGRLAVRAALLRQLEQIAADGITANYQYPEQRVSIIAHSMGCFHVYEALSYAAETPAEGLGPATFGGKYANIILMASPVQLIRTVGKGLGAAVPQLESIYCVNKDLAIPSEPGAHGEPIPFTSHFVSITGNLDPIGGYFFRHQYAYMDMDGQDSFVDQQQVARVGESEAVSLASLLRSALENTGAPTIAPNNPHDWSAYVTRHAADLKAWLA